MSESCPFCDQEFRDLQVFADHVVFEHLQGNPHGPGADRVGCRLCWCGFRLVCLGDVGQLFLSHCQEEGGIMEHFLRHHLGVDE